MSIFRMVVLLAAMAGAAAGCVTAYPPYPPQDDAAWNRLSPEMQQGWTDYYQRREQAQRDYQQGQQQAWENYARNRQQSQADYQLWRDDFYKRYGYYPESSSRSSGPQFAPGPPPPPGAYGPPSYGPGPYYPYGY